APGGRDVEHHHRAEDQLHPARDQRPPAGGRPGGRDAADPSLQRGGRLRRPGPPRGAGVLDLHAGARGPGSRVMSSQSEVVYPAWRWLGISLVELGEGNATVELTGSDGWANRAGLRNGCMMK